MNKGNKKKNERSNIWIELCLCVSFFLIQKDNQSLSASVTAPDSIESRKDENRSSIICYQIVKPK